MFSLLATILYSTQAAQAEPIGDLNKLDFLKCFANVGYEVRNPRDASFATVRSGDTQIHLQLTYNQRPGSSELFVHRASARLEFDVSATVPKKGIADWIAKEKLAGEVWGDSFLGGRVVINGAIGTSDDTRDTLRLNTEKFLDACRKLGRHLKPSGAKISAKLFELGKAPLDMKERVETMALEDMAYIIEKMGWERFVPGLGGKGWMIAGKPKGVAIIFNGMPGPNHGCGMYSITQIGKRQTDYFMRLA
ncbi:MAG: hypothetical protein ABL949_02580 [Fimbriimonadaceae bacterium]